MKLIDIKKNTKNLQILDKNYLKLIEKDANNLNANIKYWLKKNQLIALKNGFYILSDQWENNDNKDSYLEYLANQLLIPSYLSLEYVLSKYQLLTEAVYTITSVTSKATRRFNSQIASFNYYQVPKKLFTGYNILNYNNQTIFEASKAKALFDFLYLRFNRTPINQANLDSLRLNLDLLKQKDLNELNRYFKLLKNQKYLDLFNLIKKSC
jgi:predicted transcriptional regulator of viral defense system